MTPRRRTLKHWFIRRWDDVTGLHDAKDALRNLVYQVRVRGDPEVPNIAIYGPSRSGKTSLVTYALECLTCYQLDFETLTPCGGVCGSCRNNTAIYGNDGWSTYHLLIGEEVKTPITIECIPIDCSNFEVGDLEGLMRKVVSSNSPRKFCTVYFDEIHELARRRFDAKLLKPAEQFPVIWIATSAYFKTRSKGTGRTLDDMFRGRFPDPIKVQLPSIAELACWLGDRCEEAEIHDFDEDPEVLLSLVAERCRQIPGKGLFPLMRAERMGHRLSRKMIEDFPFDFSEE